MEETINFGALHQRVDLMAQRVDKIYSALLGNELTQDGGLVTRIEKLERNSKTLTERMDQMERKNIRGELYVRWMWALGGTIGYTILMAVVQYFLKK